MANNKWILLIAMATLLLTVTACGGKKQNTDVTVDMTAAVETTETSASVAEERKQESNDNEHVATTAALATEKVEEAAGAEAETENVTEDVTEDSAKKTTDTAETEIDVFAGLEELDTENLGNIG